MQAKCIICDRIDDIDDSSLQAKRLKNRRAQLYLCGKCYERIGEKTMKRHQTGKFRLYKEKKKKDFIK